MDTAKCPNCQAEVRAGDAFCARCGRGLPEWSATPVRGAASVPPPPPPVEDDVEYHTVQVSADFLPGGVKFSDHLPDPTEQTMPVGSMPTEIVRPPISDGPTQIVRNDEGPTQIIRDGEGPTEIVRPDEVGTVVHSRPEAPETAPFRIGIPAGGGVAPASGGAAPASGGGVAPASGGPAVAQPAASAAAVAAPGMAAPGAPGMAAPGAPGAPVVGGPAPGVGAPPVRGGLPPAGTYHGGTPVRPAATTYSTRPDDVAFEPDNTYERTGTLVGKLLGARSAPPKVVPKTKYGPVLIVLVAILVAVVVASIVIGLVASNGVAEFLGGIFNDG